MFGGKTRQRERDDAPAEPLLLRLYVGGKTKSIRHTIEVALQRARSTYKLEIIDAVEEPERALRDRINTVPVLLRISPEPRRRCTAGLKDPRKVNELLNDHP